MNITAIISEYNPLHNGHLYHISKSKEITKADAVICVMSGNFVQRGLPAIIDKWTRTQMALENGIDLVLELPSIYSLSSAEFFSFGAVSMLNSLGKVNNLSFGSELGSIDNLMHVANMLSNESMDFKNALKLYLKQGLPYPVARSKALIQILIEKNTDLNFNETEWRNLLSSSNNILGIEYCKSLIALESRIKVFTVKRQGADYNSQQLHEEYSSATSIRKFLKNNIDISKLELHLPPSVFNTLKKLDNSDYSFIFEEYIFPYIKHKFFTSNSNLTQLPDVSEGIENRIARALNKSTDFHELLEEIKSKRYTLSRISRILCQYFVGFEAYDTAKLRTQSCPYSRVLGFNATGAKVLKEFKGYSSIPIFTKLPKSYNECLSLDIQSTKAYSILNTSVKPFDDYIRGPIIM